MDLKAGDIVERRHGRGTSRFGRIQARCELGYDCWYVTVGIGRTHIDWGRDLRPAPEEERPFPCRIGGVGRGVRE
jgi:hypothetical protein